MTVISQVKQTLATLEGAQGILRLYLTQVRDESTQAVLEKSIATADGVIDNLQARIRVLEARENQYQGL
ncbi:MAG: DUF1657 domain-containing protein [bacterium]|jgi:predicted transglutaminase-like cysteine proteinase